jgi:hypothetical protein
MGRIKEEIPAIHRTTAALQKEAGDLGDAFLHYLFSMAVLHLEEMTDTLSLLHEEPSVRSPLAQIWLKRLWPSPPRRIERPQEGAMPQPEQSIIECRSCRFWTGRGAPAGECRRFPPIQSSILHGEVMSAAQPVWPATNADDWCGEWQVVAKW